MPLPEHTAPRELDTSFDERDPLRPYWRDSDTVMFRVFPVAGADAASFRFWAGGFGRDQKGVWCTSKRLRGADAATFEMCNFTWARDATRVWTLGGEVKDVDVATFEVCDDGVCELPTGARVPYGYAKDAANVWYYDFSGKPRLVKKAHALSFASCNDGFFATDERHVFCHGSVLPSARIADWRKLGGYYSTDGARVYYYNRRIKDADAHTFEVVASRNKQLARDAERCWRNDGEITAAELEQLANG